MRSSERPHSGEVVVARRLGLRRDVEDTSFRRASQSLGLVARAARLGTAVGAQRERDALEKYLQMKYGL